MSRLVMKNKNNIRAEGTKISLALLVTLAIGFCFQLIYNLEPVRQFLEYNTSAMGLFNIVFTLLTLGCPFGVLYAITYKQDNKTAEAMPFDIAQNKLKAVLLILVCVGGCIATNMALSFGLTLLEEAGYYSSYSYGETPSNLSDAFVQFISVAVIPPLIEELSFRGILLTRLKKYGTVFAVVVSSLLFGLFHGNITQVPFGIICGVFFSYLTLSTKSVWTAVIAHMINNSLSCLINFLSLIYDNYKVNEIFKIISLLGILVGLISLILVVLIYRRGEWHKIIKSFKTSKQAKAFFSFFSSPVTLLLITAYVVEIILSISFKKI